jgi:hypothetical protein
MGLLPRRLRDRKVEAVEPVSDPFGLSEREYTYTDEEIRAGAETRSHMVQLAQMEAERTREAVASQLDGVTRGHTYGTRDRPLGDGDTYAWEDR